MTFILEMASLHTDARPRHMVFSKIERLISHMNDQKSGVQLKDKKNFLYSTLHNSFTGLDFISWLSENKCEQDTVEAIHLATFLCMYGYVYPVDLKSFAVKEDKNIYYMFQSPYYWPSKHLKLTNEMYIIYLLKRNRRNKQKHGLEEHEQSALTKLQALFSDKIGFVTKQAEEQVKIVKDMKREDKMVHDLQERAFWKVHRPPPGQVKYIDEGPSRCYQPSQMVARRTKNRDLKIKEIAYLKKALTQARMKFSKSVDIFLQHCDQYKPYDPFLDPGAAQPSNPWISNEEMLWEINGNLVEVPTVLRIKKWALSFEDLLHDDTGRNEFEQFARKEYSQENITFYKTCKEILVCPLSKVNTLKAKIEKEFLTPGALCEVNIDGKTLEKVQEQLKNDKEPVGRSRYVFQPAMEHVYALMKKDSYARFLRSDQYKQLKEKAQNHFSKRRLFNFGSNRKKAASPLVGRRGSSSSDGQGADGDLTGPSYHSYSTGNLRELDDNPKKTLRNSYVGSDSSIYMGIYNGQSISPSLRRRNDKDQDSKTPASQDPRRRSNLEVPRSSYAGMTNSESSRKSEVVSPCLALNVPRTNVITPWDGKS